MGGLIDYRPIIDETKKLLSANSEWCERYAAYATSISENADFIRMNRRRFREWEPLKLYLNTTNAKSAKRKVTFELRYLGQTVAELTCDHESLRLSTDGYDPNNQRDFDCTIVLADCAWDGSEARAFRSHFKNRPAIRNKAAGSGNEEHRIESLLLSEFSKQKNKALPYIKPVRIAGLRFPMPTPLSASDHSRVKYANFHGGGIDMLARIGTGGRNTNLCIIELKDENTKIEPASDAMKQALIYSTFIRELLRSDTGAKWWKLFGFGGHLPNKIVLYSVCAMPYIEGADTTFDGMKYDVGGDTIRLHYIYFKEADNIIEKIYTSLPYTKSKGQPQ